MNKKQVLDLISETHLIAIIRLDDLSQAVKLSESLVKAGVTVQEYTLTNPRALDAITAVKREVEAFSNGTAAIGVGSILTAEQALSSIQAEVNFVISPIVEAGMIETCKKANTLVIPGAYSPTEIMEATQLGADLVKLFPAHLGGPQYLRDVLAPMPQVKIVPTGGIKASNAKAYLTAGAMAVGVGSNLLDTRAVEKGDWNTVIAKATHFIKKMGSQ